MQQRRDHRAAEELVTATDPRPPTPTRRADHRSDGGSTRRGVRRTVRAYVALTKPRIIETLLVTTVPTMFLAAGGFPPAWLVIVTLVGGILAAGGANTLNCYIDRDIDVVMHRTQHRPLVTGEVTPRAALVFGLVMSALATALFGLVVNWLSAGLAAFAIFFYVVVYTLLLKRRTPQNIVWGGMAGCMQVLIGWSAVTGSLTWAPFVLFLVIFFWTPPHYWPLSMRFEDDYAAAGVPMLPVVASDVVVAKQVVLYSWAMVLASLALVPVAPTGPVYAVAAVVLGGMFLLEAHRLRGRAKNGVVGRKLNPMRLFHFSITYVSLLFVALAIDPFVRF
jgi:heme o synthase